MLQVVRGVLRRTVVLVFLAPESSCDGEGWRRWRFSLQMGGRTAAGWGEPGPEQLEDTNKTTTLKKPRKQPTGSQTENLLHFQNKTASQNRARWNKVSESAVLPGPESAVSGLCVYLGGVRCRSVVAPPVGGWSRCPAEGGRSAA